jgi:hypothetical protein
MFPFGGNGGAMRIPFLAFLISILCFGTVHAQQVDLELVLAADGSGSIDDDELRLQRDGWADAITSPEVIKAIADGLIGKIAVQYMEWGSASSQVVIVDWAEISDAASATAFADALRSRPRGANGYNSISTAIDFSVVQIETNRWQGLRKVIDISADAGNFGGRDVKMARDDAVAKGFTINALTIDRGKRPGLRATYASLEDYFRAEVIGGPGAFLEVASETRPFMIAAKRKLVQEIAGMALPNDVASRQ